MKQLHYSYRSCHIKYEEGFPSELRKGFGFVRKKTVEL